MTARKPDRVAEFLTWAEHDRGRSVHTVARYRTVLNQLPDPANATVDQIQEWWDSRLEKANATRENELACLRSFYKWMARFDHRPDDPTRRLTAPKVSNAFPDPVSRTELTTLLKACDDTNAPDLRRAIALGAYGGLRVSEAATLNWTQVDRENRRLRIYGKGAKNRLAGLSPRLLDEILPDTGGNVVCGGTPYAPGTLQRKVNRFMARHGVDKTFHSLRGRYATVAIAETGNIHAVAKAMGWASINTAEAYAALSDDVLDQIALAAAA